MYCSILVIFRNSISKYLHAGFDLSTFSGVSSFAVLSALHERP
jgi:hypothetical protein